MYLHKFNILCTYAQLLCDSYKLQVLQVVYQLDTAGFIVKLAYFISQRVKAYYFAILFPFFLKYNLSSSSKVHSYLPTKYLHSFCYNLLSSFPKVLLFFLLSLPVTITAKLLKAKQSPTAEDIELTLPVFPQLTQSRSVSWARKEIASQKSKPQRVRLRCGGPLRRRRPRWLSLRLQPKVACTGSWGLTQA